VQLGIPLSVVTSLAFAAPGPATEMPMPILDEITQPDPAGMGEVLNRNGHHTLDAKDHDGSMSHLGRCCRKSLFASLGTNFTSRRCGYIKIVWGEAS
jgi:hypothetical protein